ncbi:hypothetical protein [Ancylothrix sp. D3o]|nr:hypothetical protein [Ancylothrix sp. D3o]
MSSNPQMHQPGWILTELSLAVSGQLVKNSAMIALCENISCSFDLH